MYANSDDTTAAFGVVYLVIGLGSIIFFFIGVCALLCCCRQKCRGVERKGYVIRDPEQTAPLILSAASSGSILVGPGVIHTPMHCSNSVQVPSTMPPGYPLGAPPVYESPPKY